MIRDIESDQRLQERVFSVHHIYSHTLNSTGAFKIIENNLGIAYIQQAHQVLVQAPAKNRGQLQLGEMVNPIFNAEPTHIPTEYQPNGFKPNDSPLLCSEEPSA